MKQEDFSFEERLDFIKRAEDEIGRVNTIIRLLLDISKPVKGDPEKLSVHDLLSDVAEVFRMQPSGNKIEIKLSFHAEKDIVMADLDQLRQVFVNIMLNAVDAVSANEEGRKGEIKVRTACHDDKKPDDGNQERRIVISFLDNGQGLPGEQIENIFDPFFTTKAPGKGTGLGLSVSFTLIEKMGGHIFAENRNGKGARISITLPLYI